VDNGMPNPKNSKHLTELSLVLTEMGMYEIKDELIRNLTEADEQFTNPILNKKIKYKGSDGKDKEGVVGNLLRLQKDHPGRKAAEAQLPPEDSEERKQINKDLGSQNQAKPTQPQAKDSKEDPTDGDKPTEKPQTNPMFTKDSDPAMAARMDVEKQTLDKLAKGDKTDERKKLNQTQETIRQSLNDGDFSEIVKSSDGVNTLRDSGIAGAGGPVASYGEARLTSTANEFNGDGYSNWKDNNKQAIDSEKENITKNLSKYKNRIKEVSKQLGVSDEEATEYLAQRKVFGDLELKRLEDNPDSLWHKSGKQGFNKDPEALRKWTDAQFDGAHATLYEVQNGSNIDSTKPFHVIQSNPKAGEADDAVKEHLYDQLEKAKESGNKDDITHYEREIRAFEKLGFHDTMVIGKDSNDRTTILHITNKKQNDLVDIWGNTTPEYMLNVIKKSFGPDVSEAVIKAADDGIEKCKDGKQATNRVFQSMEFDDDFIKITETKEMSKYMNVLSKR
jgi:hypothetical protein